ncbi:unnamed protein product [Hyaloperonospora brassicae]|uniref:SET domain-containing protein n=1 Tax=Hyaloperonospora brassicae TaxID=162125 RepID=A0AAV0TIK9_HYABA|nr:unnamed protein product [Hyaloperonospora brassicae]
MATTPKPAKTVKKLQTAVAHPTASFANALAVLLTSQSRHKLCLSTQSLVAIARSCAAARTVLRTWLDAVVRDISQGKEVLPLPVRFPRTATFATKLVAVVELLQTFTYATAVHVPVARQLQQYPLPLQLLEKQQQDTRWQQLRRGRQVAVFLATTKAKGWGVFAAQPIEANTFVGEYTGELVSTREVQRRYRERYDPQALNYVWSVREHVARPNEEGNLPFDTVRTNVDASSSGNATRFVNHSCAANMALEAVRVDSFVPRLALFTRVRVDAGQELTIDYSGGGSSRVVRDATEQVQGTRPCQCGARACRGYLPGGRT